MSKKHGELSAFHAKCKKRWIEAVKAVNPIGADSMVFSTLPKIVNALTPIMGKSANHAHLPTGGGQDFLFVDYSEENGCIEFSVTERLFYLMKPKKLTLEWIEADPWQSFFVLELEALKDSGFYGDGDGRFSDDHDREELVRINTEYYDRRVLDAGYLCYDENGDETPLPDDAELVVRFFRGSVLLVAKGSYWNSRPDTYDGIHNEMTVQELRTLISGWIEQAR